MTAPEIQRAPETPDSYRLSKAAVSAVDRSTVCLLVMNTTGDVLCHTCCAFPMRAAGQFFVSQAQRNRVQKSIALDRRDGRCVDRHLPLSHDVNCVRQTPKTANRRRTSRRQPTSPNCCRPSRLKICRHWTACEAHQLQVGNNTGTPAFLAAASARLSAHMFGRNKVTRSSRKRKLVHGESGT